MYKGYFGCMGDSTSLHDGKSLKQAHNIDGDIRKIVTKNLKAVEQKVLQPRESQLLKSLQEMFCRHNNHYQKVYCFKTDYPGDISNQGTPVEVTNTKQSQKVNVLMTIYDTNMAIMITCKKITDIFIKITVLL